MYFVLPQSYRNKNTPKTWLCLAQHRYLWDKGYGVLEKTLNSSLNLFLVQAVGNAKDTLGDIVNTGKDAASTVVDHVGKVVSGN